MIHPNVYITDIIMHEDNYYCRKGVDLQSEQWMLLPVSVALLGYGHISPTPNTPNGGGGGGGSSWCITLIGAVWALV